MTTTKPAGAFVQDYLDWRLKKIKDLAPQYLVNPISPVSFYNCAYFQNGVDVVKDKADSYLISLLAYYNTDIGRKAMGLEFRQAPPVEILAIAPDSDAKAVSFFTKFSKLFLLQLIYDKKKSTRYPSPIRGDIVERDMKAMTSGTYFAKITMMIYFIALKEIYPSYQCFLVRPATYAKQLEEYLTTPEVVQQFCSAAFADHQKNINITTKFDPRDNQKFLELKAKLDLVDPTFNLSCTILGLYTNTLLAMYSSQGISDTPLTRCIFQSTINYFVQKVEKDPASQFIEVVKQLKALYAGNVVAMTQKLSQAFFQVAQEDIIRMLDLNKQHVYTIDSALYLNKMHKAGGFYTDNPSFAKLKSDKNFYRFANALLLGCQIFTIGYGFANYDRLNTFEKSLFWVGTGLTIADLANTVSSAVSNTNLFIYFGQKIKSLCISNKTSVVAKRLSAMTKYVGKTFKFISKIVGPLLLVISVGLSIYDCIVAVQEQKWGMLALSALEVAAGVALFILSFFVVSSWAGPVCIVLTGALIALAVVKMLYSIVSSFVETLVYGTPEYQFIYSADSIYLISENDFFALTWTTNYKWSTSEGKQLLDIIKKNMSAEDQKIIADYGASQTTAK